MITKTSTNVPRRAALALFATFALFGAVILSNSTANAVPATVTVGQTNGGGATNVNQFNPAAVTIVSGESVTWNSALDNRTHTSPPMRSGSGTPDWQSPTLRSGTANTTFIGSYAGTYTYYCSFHARAPTPPRA